ncbi:Peptidoglycan D,D-transpeptidase MrdA [hydrothermal vent metagenome]|uniref:Peptidoglycan D,D-transpeptidase MrdA n=1 Tax=hydrothermal vent metagenome TaxID=652676 RepID=A0A3B1B883_9ZZZZ
MVRRAAVSAIKDHIRESQLINQRIIALLVIVVILLSVLIAKFAYLQIFNNQYYTTQSENNRLSVLPITPIRGLIYDRNGIVMAQNLPNYRLNVIPELSDDLDKTLAKIGELVQLSKEDIRRFQKSRRHQRKFAEVPLRFRLSEDEIAKIAVNKHLLPGVFIKAELSRHYPLGKLASHVIGYAAIISESELQNLTSDKLGNLELSNYRGTSRIGKVGIEKKYESILHGTVGIQRVETNAQGRVLKVIERKLPIPGKNLYLNLDSNLQSIAEQAFKDNNGALVAMIPKTGAILALVSMPTFDPNLFVNGLDTKQYRELSSSPQQPLFNRAIKGQYPPGSTIKPFIALAGLELDQVLSSDEIECPGYYMLKGDPRRYRDWKKTGHKETDLSKALIESCDVYFYDLSLQLGIDNIHHFLKQFGFGAKTEIDLRGEMSGLLPSRTWKKKFRQLPWFPGETLITGIGQGFTLTTPIQLANATAALANRGILKTPNLVHAIENPQTGSKELISSKTKEPIQHKSDGHWDTVISAMKNVIHSLRGTARRLNVNLDYTIAGKTGTAQVFGIKQDEEYDEEKVTKKLRDHALFISFAPVKKPEIAIAVIVENGGHGGSIAAPIARKVMDYYLKNLDKTHLHKNKENINGG